MPEHQDPSVVPTQEELLSSKEPEASSVSPTGVPESPQSVPTERNEADEIPRSNGNAEDSHRWHSRAGRQGARRVHELIAQGRLYEQEHGLKRGRQRLRQLIQLGKVYEQEHGLRPALPGKRRSRLSRPHRNEVLATLLQCLVQLARPSFRPELVKLSRALSEMTLSSSGSDPAA